MESAGQRLPAACRNVQDAGQLFSRRTIRFELQAQLGGSPVTVQAESLEIIKYDGKVIAKVGMYMTNHGGKVWNDRGFEPYLVTGSGSSFLLRHEAGAEGVPVQPKEKKLVYYITEVPSYLKTTGLRFLWTENDETLKLSLPVASFKRLRQQLQSGMSRLARPRS